MSIEELSELFTSIKQEIADRKVQLNKNFHEKNRLFHEELKRKHEEEKQRKLEHEKTMAKVTDMRSLYGKFNYQCTKIMNGTAKPVEIEWVKEHVKYFTNRKPGQRIMEYFNANNVTFTL